MRHERLIPSEAKELKSKRGRENRRIVAFPELLLGNGEITRVDVLDLSYDGCAIETPIELEEGSALKLSVVALGAHDAHVRGYANGKAGLSFAVQSSWEKRFKPRAADRIELTAQLSLRRVGRKGYRARVFDVSADGCKVEFIERPRLDELVWVKFDWLEAVEASVCWVDGHYGGLKYLRPIYPAVFELLLTRLLGVEED